MGTVAYRAEGLPPRRIYDLSRRVAKLGKSWRDRSPADRRYMTLPTALTQHTLERYDELSTFIHDSPADP